MMSATQAGVFTDQRHRRQEKPQDGVHREQWGNPAVICLGIKPNRQAHVHLAKVTKYGTGLSGGSQRWRCMEIAKNSCRAQKKYSHVPDGDWKTTRPYGIYYKEDSSKPDTHNLIVRLDGSPGNSAVSNGAWIKTASKRRTDWTQSCLTQMAR